MVNEKKNIPVTLKLVKVGGNYTNTDFEVHGISQIQFTIYITHPHETHAITKLMA